MMKYYNLIKPLVFCLKEESAHNLSISALGLGIVPRQKQINHTALNQTLWGLHFNNPIGLAAGFDKNASVIRPLTQQGFGFVETGTCTPIAQSGNPKPRLFRLKEDQAIINRMGFNNKGSQHYVKKLKNFRDSNKVSTCIVGANIGKNKTTPNGADDYVTMMNDVYTLCDYITINISSPNTPGLRELQENNALDSLLKILMQNKARLISATSINTPILLKIAPDITENEAKTISEIALEHQIDGLIISNTTIAKDNLQSPNHTDEQGGLSGRPLFKSSTALLASIYRATEGNIPLIGAGGVSSAEDAYAKIRHGASLVQIYSALIYQGFELIPQINEGLMELLKSDGFTHINQAIGADV